MQVIDFKCFDSILIMPFQESIEKLLSEVLLHCIMLSVVFFVALLWASTEVNEQHFNHNGFVLIGQTFVQRQAFIDGRTTGKCIMFYQ